MDVYAKKHNVQLIIASGDNFYPVGVSGTGDAHWKVSFEDIYNKPSHQVPWYPVLGNHDYGSNPQAEIAYSSLSTRWKMPARYYTVTKNIDASHSVLFTFTDTSPFVTSYYGGGYADLKLQDTACQLTWLRNTLTLSTATWKIVIGHHPVYSAGSHGNTPELIARFKPLFLQTQTNFYICGHEHNLQALAVPNEQVHYLISGGGGYLSSYPVSPNAYAVFSKPSAGFMVMTLYTGKANIYFYDEKGVLLYQEEVKK
jgi:acid phosphatase